MSDNKFTMGLVGLLVTPVPKEKRDEVFEDLDEFGLRLNYKGTMIYSVIYSEPLTEAFGLHILGSQMEEKMQFTTRCKASGHPIEQVKTFVDLWYDGTDSNISESKAEEFNL